MLDPVHDECGVVAIYRFDAAATATDHGSSLVNDRGSDLPVRPEAAGVPPEEIFEGSVTRLVPDMLIDLQNRGQLAAGLTRYCEGANQLIDTYKEVGSVSDVFHLTHPDRSRFDRIVNEYAGRAAIGHVRYATCGREDRAFAQPFERHHGRKWKWFSFCFNGNVANYAEAKQILLDKGDYHLALDTDTEVLMHHLAYAFKGDSKPSFVEVFSQVSEALDGAFSLAFLNADGDLILARDPLGIRPLVWGVKGNLFAAASESLALTNQGFSDIRDVEPGHLIHVTRSGCKIEKFAESPRKAHCFFEWVYFANVASRINKRSVYIARTRLGEALAAGEAERESIDANDCVAVPVPDTAKAACDAMAHALGIPSREGLIRNRYVGRTFIEGASRVEKARRKYTALPEVLRGKRVFLVEDSIVRSTTLRVIIGMIRGLGGAKEVHVRVACPPIMAPCGYGIDMSTVSELIAPNFFDEPRSGPQDPDALERLAKELDADTLRYLSVDELTTALDLPREELCLGCLLGRYPSEGGQEVYRRALANRGKDGGRRTYEEGGGAAEMSCGGAGEVRLVAGATAARVNGAS